MFIAPAEARSPSARRAMFIAPAEASSPSITVRRAMFIAPAEASSPSVRRAMFIAPAEASSPSVRRAMFIVTSAPHPALRQEGNVRLDCAGILAATWPSWRRAMLPRIAVYKHGPPDGGHIQVTSQPHPPSARVRRAMFIAPSRGTFALRQDGHVLMFPHIP